MVRRPMFVLRAWFVSDIVLSRVGATRSSLSRIRDTQIQKSSTSDRIALVRCLYYKSQHPKTNLFLAVQGRAHLERFTKGEPKCM